jgi:hypothetical protein
LVALQSVQQGVAVRLTYDNVKAASLATQLIIILDSLISEVHVQSFSTRAILP